MNDAITRVLETLSPLIQSNAWIAPLLAILAGALTFTALGAAAALIGKLMAFGTSGWWYMLLLYSIGHSILVLFAGTFMDLTGKLSQSDTYGVVAKAVNIALGLAILLAGLYLVYLGF